METKRDVPEIDDFMIVAYLHNRGHKYEPVIREGGRVVFKIYGDCDAHLREMYEGFKVNIMDYMKSLKFVRASMFTKKDEYNREKRKD